MGLGLALAALALAWPASPARAVVYMSQREALQAAFPQADRIDYRTWVLSEEQAAAVTQLARVPLESRLVALHVARRGEQVLGYALIDVHTVRTLPEALLIALTPDGRIERVQVLAFHEPVDYQPTERWYQQLAGRDLRDPLQLMRDIDAVSGATLSTRAALYSVRRALALHHVLLDGAEEAPE